MPREVTESPIRQGKDEAIKYHLSTTPVGTQVLAVTVYDETTSTDVTSTVASGSAVMQNGVIILPLISALQQGHKYRAEVRYTDGTNTLEPYFYIYCER
jgi:3-polyprenyl-4-hydroxybenzoate decarboxylase